MAAPDAQPSRPASCWQPDGLIERRAMPIILDLLPREQQLRLAAVSKPPTRLAETFAAYAGQFCNRADFDALAREVDLLYAVTSHASAVRFRERLDARLDQHCRAPVLWDVGGNGGKDGR